MSPFSKSIKRPMFHYIRKATSIIVLGAFVLTSVKSPVYAQSVSLMPSLPRPGMMVALSPGFTPAYLQGITIHPDNALQFDFLIYKGDKVLEGTRKSEEYRRLVKYFLASLTIPDGDQWVNLSPYERNRIIKDDFGKTEMGRDLLAEDYLLKQRNSGIRFMNAPGRNITRPISRLIPLIRYGSCLIPPMSMKVAIPPIFSKLI